jgi:hypothetical protein
MLLGNTVRKCSAATAATASVTDQLDGIRGVDHDQPLDAQSDPVINGQISRAKPVQIRLYTAGAERVSLRTRKSLPMGTYLCL